MTRTIAAVPAWVLTGVALLATPAESATLVVLNKSEATASLVDVDSGNVVATLPTGDGPHEAAVSPDGRLALVSNYGREAPGSTLTLIEVPAARVVRTIRLGEHRRPHGVAWLADGRRALVTAEDSKALLVVDTQAGAVEVAIPTGQDVSHMVVATRDGARAFVANIGSGTVTVVDVPGRKVVSHVTTGAGAEGIDLTPDGREVWVTNRGADSVSVLDASSLKVLATLGSRAFPIRVKVTPDGRQALVSNARSGDVAVFDVAARKEIRRIPMRLPAASTEGRLMGQLAGSVPIGIVVSPDGKRAWVANANADAVAVVDLATGAVVGTLTAGREPDGMAWSPASAKP